MSGLRTGLAELTPRPFGFVHLIWVILILACCVALVMMGGGHPPPMIFVLPLLAAGLVGHLLLLLVAWLLGKGHSRVTATQVGLAHWPIELGLIALVLGGLSIVGIAVYVLRAQRIRSVLG